MASHIAQVTALSYLIICCVICLRRNYFRYYLYLKFWRYFFNVRKNHCSSLYTAFYSVWVTVHSLSVTQFQATVYQITASHQSSIKQRAYFDYMFFFANYLSQLYNYIQRKYSVKHLHKMRCKKR